MIQKLNFNCYQLTMLEVIIVLGCSNVLRQKNKESGKITRYFHSYSRLMKTIQVYKYISNRNKIIICSGYNNQSTNMKKFLIERGIDKKCIYEESLSKNTIENCIFSYQLLKSTDKINIHLVTNDYHIARSKIIFNYFTKNKTVYCYPSNILDFIGDVTLDDKKEIQQLHLKDADIIKTKLKHSLQEYSF